MSKVCTDMELDIDICLIKEICNSIANEKISCEASSTMIKDIDGATTNDEAAMKLGYIFINERIVKGIELLIKHEGKLSDD